MLPDEVWSTEYQEDSVHQLNIAEVRKDLGLFADTSEDALVQLVMTSAKNWVESSIEQPISSVIVHDYYKYLAKVMKLSYRIDDGPAEVHYYDSRGMDTLFTGEVTVDRNENRRTVVVLDAVPDIEYSNGRVTHCFVRYRTKELDDQQLQMALLAIRKYSMYLWEGLHYETRQSSLKAAREIVSQIK